MSKIHFNNTFSSGCVQFMAADWPATTAHKMIYLLTSYTVRLPTVPENRNKCYFDQNDNVLIPNVTQFVQKTYFIANKVRKFQLIAD